MLDYCIFLTNKTLTFVLFFHKLSVGTFIICGFLYVVYEVFISAGLLSRERRRNIFETCSRVCKLFLATSGIKIFSRVSSDFPVKTFSFRVVFNVVQFRLIIRFRVKEKFFSI